MITLQQAIILVKADARKNAYGLHNKQELLDALAGGALRSVKYDTVEKFNDFWKGYKNLTSKELNAILHAAGEVLNNYNIEFD